MVLAVHHRPVPLAHDLEIRGALAERRTRAPAVAFQEIGRRGEHVGYAMPEIDVSVAIIIHAIFDVACIKLKFVSYFNYSMLRRRSPWHSVALDFRLIFLLWGMVVNGTPSGCPWQAGICATWFAIGWNYGGYAQWDY
jgi:hypothetical protein